MRTAWTSRYASSPNLTRQQLRHRIPAVYAWLYRNDRDWLDAQPPAAVGHISNKPRLDWPSIDATTAQTIEREAAWLRSLDPPQQITRLALECALGQRGWLEKRLQKLPVCVAVLSEVTESVEDFQCRRVSWAAEKLLKQGLPIQVWRLRRLAGLPDECTAKVESLILEIADEWSPCNGGEEGRLGTASKMQPRRETVITGRAERSARQVGKPLSKRKYA